MTPTPKARAIPDALLAIIQSGTCEGDRYLMPPLDRTDYVAVNKVLNAAGLKWNKKVKAHIASGGDAADAIEALVVTGEYKLPADFGAFDTPEDLANEIVALAEIQPGMTVLEPSAGIGNLVRPLIAARSQVTAVELQPERLPEDLKSHLNVKYFEGDFIDLAADPQPIFDRVVMNPPFAKRQDVEHVLSALQWLKPDGKLVAIMSAGVTFRQDRMSIGFRDLVWERGGAITDNPAGSFVSSGTAVNTVAVTIPA